MNTSAAIRLCAPPKLADEDRENRPQGAKPKPEIISDVNNHALL
jgi:hypothetical protein